MVLSLLGMRRAFCPEALGPEAWRRTGDAVVSGKRGSGDDQDLPALAPGMRHRHYAPESVTLRFTDEAGLEAAWPGGDAIRRRGWLGA